MRAPTAADLRLLIQSAGSPTSSIQLAAIRGLGRLERRDVVTDLLPYLRATSDEVRMEAAFAIAQGMRGEPLPLDPRSDQLDGVMQALLSAAAAERRPEVLGKIAISLGRLPYEKAQQVQRAEGMLRKIAEVSSELALDVKTASAAFPAVDGGVYGLEMLARLNPKLVALSDETIALLRRIAVGGTEGPRERALRAVLAARALDEETLRPNLTRESPGGGPAIRRLAVAALGGSGSPITGREQLDALLRALRDREFSVRYEALRGYARTQAKTEGCLPIMGMLLDESRHVALAALDALGDACAGDEDAINRLIAEARTPPNQGNDWQRESHALVALAKVSPPHSEIPLLAHSRHLLWQVRMYAARAAGLLNDVATLERLALDPHDNVRDAALGPLRRLRGGEAERFFIAALGRTDYQLLRTAAREMRGMTPTPGLTTALLDAVHRVTQEKKETSRDTRVAILERLREFGSARQEQSLLPLLRDFDPRVAAEAAATLREWTGRAHTTDPQLLVRPSLPAPSELAIVTEKLAVLKMESGGEIAIKLDPVHAPLASTRILRLVNANYYDGLTFHRVASNFVLQGGSPGANEYAGDGQYLRDEISPRSHLRGTVGLSTRGRDTGDAQLFINLVDNPRLDFDYTIVGRVTDRSLPRIDRIMEGERIVNVTFVAPSGPR